MITKPMLATAVKSIDDLTYPLIASPKLDGIRCLMVGGKVLSRSFKPIQNDYIRKTLTNVLPEGADGEIIVGDNFQEVSSGVMRKTGEPDFTYWMFDLAPKGADAPPYAERLQAMREWAETHLIMCVVIVPTTVINDVAELLAYEEKCIAGGYEGVMLRAHDGPYKCGRATLKQGWLMKLKRFKDSEAVILGFEEQMLNTNRADKDAFGRTKRSSAKAGKVGKGTLGKFRVRDVHSGVEFEVGTGEGLTQKLRQKIWDDRDAYLGKTIKYKFQPHGVKEKPRLPIWLGFRDADDLGGDE